MILGTPKYQSGSSGQWKEKELRHQNICLHSSSLTTLKCLTGNVAKQLMQNQGQHFTQMRRGAMLELFAFLLVITPSVSVGILRASLSCILRSWWQHSFYKEISQHFFKVSSPSCLSSTMTFSTKPVLDCLLLLFPTHFPSLTLQ